MNQQLEFDNQLFVPANTVEAMRDSRYRHPANALAELIDNSIDARARKIDLLIREKDQMVNTRRRARIQKIAIFDNGHGMSKETLVQALRFGGRKEANAINVIGKYGMGLPTASVSQCKRLDVWTWEADITRAWHSYIDIQQINDGIQRTIPDPDQTPIPAEWMTFVSKDTRNNNQGTIVVWSDIDRITVQAETIFRQIEEEIGRIYRHYINQKELTVRMASIKNEQGLPYIDRVVRPNDPLYLMHNSSTPEPWSEEPMFEPTGSRTFKVKDGGPELTVDIQLSVAKREALGETKASRPGQRPYGVHALKNLGVSIVRENREILMENYFSREGGGNAIPQNRWWGCEVRFTSDADNLFGVDHNKQMVANLSRALKDLYEGMTTENSNTDSVIQELEAEDQDIYEIAGYIRSSVNGMMAEIHRRFEQRPDTISSAEQTQPETLSIEQAATTLMTTATRTSVENEGEELTSTDKDRKLFREEERIQDLTQGLIDVGYSPEQAQESAASTIKKDEWYKFTPTQLDGYRIFSVRAEGAVLHVRLNINNHLYDLIKMIEDEAEQNNNEIARNAAIAIRSLILSWARMEDGTEDLDQKLALQEMSEKWGKLIHRILETLEVEHSLPT